MNFPNDDTGQVLAEMHEAGVDLSITHAVTFFQLFEEKSQAEAMAEHLRAKAPEMKLSVHPDKETPNVWDLDCVIDMVPFYDAIVAQEAQLEKIARQFDGYNDGWGIAVD